MIAWLACLALATVGFTHQLAANNEALVLLFHMLSVDADLSPDLSTPRGALKYIRDFFCLSVPTDSVQWFATLYDHYLSQVENVLSPESVQKIHKITKETVEEVHRSLLRAKSRDEPVQTIADHIQTTVIGHLVMVNNIVQEELRTAESHAKHGKGAVDALAPKDVQGEKPDSYGVVE